MALHGKVFGLTGNFVDRDAIYQLVSEHKGTISPTVHKRVNFIIATEDALRYNTQRVRKATKFGIPTVSQRFLTACIKANAIVDHVSFLVTKKVVVRPERKATTSPPGPAETVPPATAEITEREEMGEKKEEEKAEQEEKEEQEEQEEKDTEEEENGEEEQEEKEAEEQVEKEEEEEEVDEKMAVEQVKELKTEKVQGIPARTGVQKRGKKRKPSVKKTRAIPLFTRTVTYRKAVSAKS
jgi:flagellar biosynthesis GTPase FlhF